MEATMADPPRLRNGKTMPVMGIRPIKLATWMKAWRARLQLNPEAISFPKRSSVLEAMEMPLNTIRPSRIRTMRQPTKPNSSATRHMMPSVGRVSLM